MSDSDNKKLMICKSIARNKYFLTEKDLEDLEHTESKNPHYKRAANMVLYDENDIIYKACLKHGCEVAKLNQKLEQFQQEREIKKEIRRSKKEAEMDKRRLLLSNALEEKDLQIRYDSKLCLGYIDGTITNKTIEQIVKRMCQVKYLFDYCDMRKHIRHAINEAKEYQFYYDKDEVFATAEQQALEKNGGKYPDVFPWLI